MRVIERKEFAKYKRKEKKEMRWLLELYPSISVTSAVSFVIHCDTTLYVFKLREYEMILKFLAPVSCGYKRNVTLTI